MRSNLPLAAVPREVPTLTPTFQTERLVAERRVAELHCRVSRQTESRLSLIGFWHYATIPHNETCFKTWRIPLAVPLVLLRKHRRLSHILSAIEIGMNGMPDQFLFKSDTYENCNCEINCGCQFSLPSTYGFCQSAMIGEIVAGHFNGIPLSNLRWAAIYKWPGEVHEGHGKRQIVIDERAEANQRHGMEKIISGRSCEPQSNIFSVFGTFCSEFAPTLFLPIGFTSNLDARTAQVEVPGVLSSRAAPKVNEFTGEPLHVAIARPTGCVEYTYAELGLGSTTVTGDIEMAYVDSWAHFCVHHFDQDGLVRERSRLTAWLDA